MDTQEFKAWFEGYIEGGGTDVKVIAKKLKTVQADTLTPLPTPSRPSWDWEKIGSPLLPPYDVTSGQGVELEQKTYVQATHSNKGYVMPLWENAIGGGSSN